MLDTKKKHGIFAANIIDYGMDFDFDLEKWYEYITIKGRLYRIDEEYRLYDTVHVTVAHRIDKIRHIRYDVTLYKHDDCTDYDYTVVASRWNW